MTDRPLRRSAAPTRSELESSGPEPTRIMLGDAELGNPPTVFHLTHHKAGSQWLLRVLEEVAPRRVVIPQPDNTQFFSQPILPGMVYPTLYLTRQQFEAVPVPDGSVAFAVIRDLRDTLISMYFSQRDSHPLMFTPTDLGRERLRMWDVADGLRWLMSTWLPWAEKVQLSWVHSGVPVIRYEDLVVDAFAGFQQILALCRIEVSDATLRRVLDDASFEKVSGGRRLGESGGVSHLRRGAPGGWRELLKGKTLAQFKARFDSALIETGYEKDDTWGSELLEGETITPPRSRPEIPFGKNACWCGNTELERFSEQFDRCPRCATLVCRLEIGRVAPYGERAGSKERPQNWLPGFNNPDDSPDGLALIRQKVVEEFWAEEFVAILDALLTRVAPPGRVLQIGDGTTGLSELFAAAGFEPLLLQSSAWFAENVAPKFEIHAMYGRLEDQGIEKGSLQAVVLRAGALGRCERPAELLAVARGLLADDGILLVSERIPHLEGSYDELRSRGVEGLDPDSEVFKYVLTTDCLDQLVSAAGYPAVETSRLKQELDPWTHLISTWTIAIGGNKPFSGVAAAGQRLHVARTGRLIGALLAARKEIHKLNVRRDEDRLLAFEQLNRVRKSVIPASAQDFIELGAGWHSPETFEGVTFRWVSSPAHLAVATPSGKRYRLKLDVEPGPGISGEEMELQLCTVDGRAVASRTIRGKETLFFEVPVGNGSAVLLNLVTPTGGRMIEGDPRVLDFRVFELSLKPTPAAQR